MNINLPDPLHAAAKRMAAKVGFQSAEEYVSELIRRDLEGKTPPRDPDAYLREALASGGDPLAVTQESLARRKKEIDALLLEGVESGTAMPMKSGDWQAIRERIELRLGKPLS